MGIIISLTAFPVIIALILLVTKGDKTRNGVMAFASIAMTAAAIAASGIVFSFWREVLQIPFWIRKLCRDRYCGSDCDLSDL